MRDKLRVSAVTAFISPGAFSFRRFSRLFSGYFPASILRTGSGRRSAELDQRRPTITLKSQVNVSTAFSKFLDTFLNFKKYPSLYSDPSVFALILKSCSCGSYLNTGLCIHGHLIKNGLLMWDDGISGLSTFYLRVGWNREAYRLFEEMPLEETERVFHFVMRSFWYGGFLEEVLLLFDHLLALGFSPAVESVCFAIMACGDLKRLDKGRWMQDFVACSEFSESIVVGNSLISMFVKFGRLDFAHSVFNFMSNRDIVSWNSLITGYAQTGRWSEAFSIFMSMMTIGVFLPNYITVLGLALACGHARDVGLGKCIHAHGIRRGVLSNFRVGTAILDMYAKSGDIESAERVFQLELSEKSLVSWNSLLSGFAQNGYHLKAVMHFRSLIRECKLQFDSFSFANVLPAYSGLGNIEAIKSIHALIMKRGLDMQRDVVLGTAMVDAYGKCAGLAGAQSLFTCIRDPNVATWNAMIAAYCRNNHAAQGMLQFCRMLQSVTSPDAVTMLEVLKLYGELGSLKLGAMVHAFCLLRGFCAQHTLETALIDMYMNCSAAERAEQLFNSMPVKHTVTWNTMLSGYVKFGYDFSSIKLFSKMLQESDHRPDSVTVLCLVQASAAVTGCHSTFHAFVVKLGLDHETSLMNSLMDAYAKSGIIGAAISLFKDMNNLRDRCSWNVVIAACGMNGQGFQACELLDQMEEDGYQPDTITFTALLSSCSHSGLVEEGCIYFDLMRTKYNIKPTLEHWTCIISMLGRAGRLEEAFHLITSGVYEYIDGDYLPHYSAVWGSLLDSCKTNKNVELGKLVGETLMKLSPENSGYHILLSNLYASNNQLDDAANLRRVFQDGHLLKQPGLSLAQLSH